MCIIMQDLATGFLVDVAPYLPPIFPNCSCDYGMTYQEVGGVVITRPCPNCAAGKHLAVCEDIDIWTETMDSPAPRRLIDEAHATRVWYRIECKLRREREWARRADILDDYYEDWRAARYDMTAQAL